MSKPKKTTKKADVVKPCFAYPGGKTRLLKQILPLIPKHQTYVESFAGGLAVLLAKPRSKYEVVNDLNSELANFYRYVRFHLSALLDEMEYHLSSRENFQLLLENPGYTDLQRAARWFLLKAESFGGMSENFGRAAASFTGFDRKRHSKLISDVSERLNRVKIENKDWQEIVDFFDSPSTLFFFDPPYVACQKTAYDAFSEFEMERLRSALDSLQGSFILTCDDSPQCRRIFEGLDFVSCEIKYSTSNTRAQKAAKRKTSQELIVVSEDIASNRKAA